MKVMTWHEKRDLILAILGSSQFAKRNQCLTYITRYCSVQLYLITPEICDRLLHLVETELIPSNTIRDCFAIWA